MPDSTACSYTIVVPCKDENASVSKRLIDETKTLFKGAVDILIVDDGSRTPNPFAACRHPCSKGYGASIKTGILATNSTWIITMDGDGQHQLRDVERLIEFTKDFPEVDMVVGDRRLRETEWKRYIGRKFLNGIASIFAWRWIADLNSGLRIFRRDVCFSYFPILCNGFSFTTSLTLSMLADNYKVDLLPIRVLPRIHGESQVKVWKDGWTTLKMIFWIGGALRTRRIRNCLRPFYSWARK